MEMKMKILMVLFVALAMTGCGGSDNGKAGGETNKPPENSIAKDAIDGFTGKTYVDAGQRAKKTLTKIADKEKKDLDTVLDGK